MAEINEADKNMNKLHYILYIASQYGNYEITILTA